MHPTQIRIPRLFTGKDGKSHWGEASLRLTAKDPSSLFSDLLKSDSVRFRWASPDIVNEWHTAPRRQLVVTLTGEVEYEIGSGETRRFGPGSIFLADDTTGQGHLGRGVGSQPRLSMYIPVPNWPDLD